MVAQTNTDTEHTGFMWYFIDEIFSNPMLIGLYVVLGVAITMTVLLAENVPSWLDFISLVIVIAILPCVEYIIYRFKKLS